MPDAFAAISRKACTPELSTDVEPPRSAVTGCASNTLRTSSFAAGTDAVENPKSTTITLIVSIDILFIECKMLPNIFYAT